jgi:hypothetical protein
MPLSTTSRYVMGWEAIGVGVSAVIAVVAFNAWAMKLVIDNAVKSALLLISHDYVTKEDFNRHIEQCPATKKIGANK